MLAFKGAPTDRTTTTPSATTGSTGTRCAARIRITTRIVHSARRWPSVCGIQEFHGKNLMVLPDRRTDRPDRSLREERFPAFLDAS
jgi:hypothetical protein